MSKKTTTPTPPSSYLKRQHNPDEVDAPQLQPPKIEHVADTPEEYDLNPLLGALAFLSLSALLGVWIMQQSINAYVLQTYHKPSLLTSLDNGVWRLGATVGQGLYTLKNHASDAIDHTNQAWVNHFNTHHAYTPQYKDQLIKKQQTEALLRQQEALQQAKQAQADHQKKALADSLTLDSSKKVFFAGDSLMQGVAPHVQKQLQHLGIQSINLSKQSTGLAYPSFFDWQTTIKTTIEADRSIKILVMLLGANDPWDMPARGGKYLKFQSPEWDNEYQARMRDILTFTAQHHVGVIWITPPNMKKDKLNQQMIYLNRVMNQELTQHNIKIIDARPLLGGIDDVYSDYLIKDEQKIKTRSGDGIHLSVDGQRLLAKEIQSHFIIQ